VEQFGVCYIVEQEIVVRNALWMFEMHSGCSSSSSSSNYLFKVDSNFTCSLPIACINTIIYKDREYIYIYNLKNSLTP